MTRPFVIFATIPCIDPGIGQARGSKFAKSVTAHIRLLAQTRRMLRALLLLLAVLIPVGLIYLFGFWVLVAVPVLAGATFVISNGKGRGREATQGGRLTGYRTTSFTDI
jgi:hypothetical protein